MKDIEEQWTAKVSRLEMQVAVQKAAANGSMNKWTGCGKS
jgi:hypothetical protein